MDLFRIISLAKMPIKCGPIFLYIFLYSKYLLVSREHTRPMGLCDVVSSREILINSILELRPRNESYRKVPLL